MSKNSNNDNNNLIEIVNIKVPLIEIEKQYAGKVHVVAMFWLSCTRAAQSNVDSTRPCANSTPLNPTTQRAHSKSG